MSKSTINFNTILAILVVLIALVTLTLQVVRTESHLSTFIDDVEYKRGEIISSGDEYVEVVFGSAIIYLDKNTEVKLVDGRMGKQVINIIQGRVVIDGVITIQTREVFTEVDGVASFVHYSWLDEIDVALIEGATRIKFEENVWNLDHPVKVRTLPEHSIKEIEFNPEESSAAEFYDRILNKKTAE